MKKSIVLSKTANKKLSKLLEYLEKNWSKKVKDDFIVKLDRSLLRISNFPYSCPESAEVKGLFKCVVSKQNTLFYRVTPTEIQIVTLFDSRQDPSKIFDDVNQSD